MIIQLINYNMISRTRFENSDFVCKYNVEYEKIKLYFQIIIGTIELLTARNDFNQKIINIIF